MNESAGSPNTFAEVFSRAVQARGLSLDRIRARLEVAGVPVSNATLSYWQSGRSLPTRARSLRTLAELETILAVEPGSLIEILRTADGRTRRQLFAWQDVMPSADIAEQIIADMGIDVAGRISRVTVHDTITIDQNRREATQVTRQVLRAERSGVRSLPIVSQQDTEENVCPEIEGIFGCHIGHVVEVPERKLTIAELVLPRPLQRGEVVLTEHMITLAPNTTPSYRVARACPDPMRGVALAVQFDPRALPTSVESCTQASLHDPEAPATDVTPIEVFDCQAQVVKLDVPPAVYSLRWTWD